MKAKDEDGNIMYFQNWKHIAKYMMKQYGWSEVVQDEN